MLNDDVAIPIPDTDAPADGEILRPSQRRRIEALQSARGVLANTPALFAGSKIDGTRSVGDLIVLAEWILFGSDEPDTSDADAAYLRQQGYISGVRDAATFADAGGENFDSLLGDAPSARLFDPVNSDIAQPSFIDLPPTGALAENDGV
jgi:hypothetical protein